MRFNGSDYIHKVDSKRLSQQHTRIKNLMIDQKWRTLKEISRSTGDPEASISAQLRHLKKPRFGMFVLEKRPRGSRKDGLFEYRIMPPGYKSEFEVMHRRNRMREALEFVWQHPECTDQIKAGIKEIFKK